MHTEMLLVVISGWLVIKFFLWLPFLIRKFAVHNENWHWFPADFNSTNLKLKVFLDCRQMCVIPPCSLPIRPDCILTKLRLKHFVLRYASHPIITT